MIIDFHTHAFPDALYEKAMHSLSTHSGNMKPAFDGSVYGLNNILDDCGVDMAVVLNIATNPKQMTNVNDFAISLNRGRLISFGSVHPDAPCAIEELHRLAEAGIKGIKLHPDYQNFFVDDERVFQIYETAAKLKLITVFHAGVDIGYPNPVHCTPPRLKAALPVFGGGIAVAAHMGGYLMWNEVMHHLAGSDIYFDTSFSYSKMPVTYAVDMVKSHGPGKFLLGSDLPWSRTDDEIRFIKSWGLSAKDETKILGENARILLGL